MINAIEMLSLEWSPTMVSKRSSYGANQILGGLIYSVWLTTLSMTAAGMREW